MPYCTNCGKKIHDESIFCSYCGSKVISSIRIPEFSIGINLSQHDEKSLVNFAEILNRNHEGIRNRTELVRALISAEKEGSGISQLVAIYREYVDVPEHAAETRMRTWSSQAYNKASWQRSQESAPYKEWFPALQPDRTRPSHLAMKGVVIPVEDYFIVPGFIDRYTHEVVPEAMMMYPGDISCNPHKSQVCRCRCTIGPRFLKKK